ncbi:MAG TPA: oxidoreductase [Chloroflexota bacterium]|nr:oxidoreductase [Chloroflexota bacterium]
MSDQDGIDLTTGSAPRRPRIATVWLGGCSGCHMSFLDLDERLLELAALADVVYSPIADVKKFPEDVDLVLVEGAVVNQEHVESIHLIRQRARTLVSLGDCAVTGNVSALRNLVPVEDVLRSVYLDRVSMRPRIPDETGIVPRLLSRVEPLHRLVKVDAFLPGCPPTADLIWESLLSLLSGTAPPDERPVPRFG